MAAFFVAKGKTRRVERSQVGDVGDNWRSHSESGWMNHQIVGDYLRHLRAQMPNRDRIFLVCDVHASHPTKDVKELAAELNAVRDVLKARNGLSDATLHSAWLRYQEDGADD
jgi:hypothetical protein